MTDILGQVNTRKACGPDHITNKIIRNLIPTLHIILQDLLNICVFHGYHPRAWKRAWALMVLQADFPPLLPEQSRFRKHHSTNDKLFELTQAVYQAQRLSRHVGAIFLDIEKAFDRVWHNGLRYKLLHMNAPALLLR